MNALPTSTAALALATLLLAAPPAAAASPEALSKAVGELYNPWIDVVDGTTGGLTSERIAALRGRRDCRQKAEAIAKRLPSEVVLSHPSFNLHPAVVVTEDGRQTLRPADLVWFCEQFDRTLAEASLELEVNATVQLVRVVEAKGLGDDQVRAMSQETIKWLSTGKAACTLAFSEAAKVFGPDDVIRLGATRVPFKDLPNPCDRYDAARPFYEAAWQKRSEPLYALYRAAGIGGDRLELFVYYGSPSDGGWLAKGCQDYVTDPGALKAAKVLFQWAEGSEHYSVRKYVFTGDRYKLTTQNLPTEARAYAACR